MNKIQYQAHLLLYSKHRLLLNVLIYILICSINHNLFNDKTFVECMIRSSSSSSPVPSKEIINSLQQEIVDLKEHVTLLNQEIERLNETFSLEKLWYQTEIEILEENQRHLIGETRLLKSRLLEADESIGKLATDNMDIRDNLMIQRQYNDGLRKSLELSEERNKDLAYEISRLEKNKYRGK